MSQSYCPACGTRLSPSRLRTLPHDEGVRGRHRRSLRLPLMLFFLVLIALLFFLSPLNRTLRPLLPGHPRMRETPGTFEWDGEYLTSRSGNFFIRLPSPPSFEISQLHTETGVFDEYIFTAQDKENQCRVLFTFLDDKTCQALDFTRPAEALDNLHKMKIIDGNPLGASPLLFYDLWPGVEFQLEIIPRQGTSLRGSGRAFLKGKTLYVMETVRPWAPGLPEGEDSNSWIDSFGLITTD